MFTGTYNSNNKILFILQLSNSGAEDK